MKFLIFAIALLALSAAHAEDECTKIKSKYKGLVTKAIVEVDKLKKRWKETNGLPDFCCINVLI